MSTTIERRLNKLEEIRGRNDVGSEVDISLERMGTSRAEMLADFGNLTAFSATGSLRKSLLPIIRPES